MELATSKKSQIIAAMQEIDDPAALGEIAQAARDRSRKVAKTTFAEGDRVRFTSSRGEMAGRTIEGTVKSVNRKTVSVEDLEFVVDKPSNPPIRPGAYYRVPPSMLRPAG